MTNPYPPFTIFTNTPKHSPTKTEAPFRWDFLPESRKLVPWTPNEEEDGFVVMRFSRLIIGEDAFVRPMGDDDYHNLGQLVGFALNEDGIAIPHSLAPQWRGNRS
jgi:hypothetical protein